MVQTCRTVGHMGASGVVSITLLQYHNYILHVAVRKVNPDVGPT